jgi:hypothetical protein
MIYLDIYGDCWFVDHNFKGKHRGHENGFTIWKTSPHGVCQCHAVMNHPCLFTREQAQDRLDQFAATQPGFRRVEVKERPSAERALTNV